MTSGNRCHEKRLTEERPYKKNPKLTLRIWLRVVLTASYRHKVFSDSWTFLVRTFLIRTSIMASWNIQPSLYNSWISASTCLRAPDTKLGPIDYLVWMDQMNGLFLLATVLMKLIGINSPIAMSKVGGRQSKFQLVTYRGAVKAQRLSMRLMTEKLWVQIPTAAGLFFLSILPVVHILI